MPEKSDPWQLYILKDETGKLYIGMTQNLTGRLARHRRATGTMHTAGFVNPSVAYTEEYPTRAQAAAREKALKHLTRAQKLALTENSD